MEYKHTKPLGILYDNSDEYNVVIEDGTNKVYTKTVDEENDSFEYCDCGKKFTYFLNNPWSDDCDNIYTKHRLKENLWQATKHVIVYDTIEVYLWSEERDSEEDALENLDSRMELLTELYYTKKVEN